MTVQELMERLKRAPKTAEVVIRFNSDGDGLMLLEAYPHRYYNKAGKWCRTEFNLDAYRNAV